MQRKNGYEGLGVETQNYMMGVKRDRGEDEGEEETIGSQNKRRNVLMSALHKICFLPG